MIVARIITTRLLLWAHGMAVHPGLILLRPDFRDDRALIEHERCHCEQMADLGTLAFWWAYITRASFRQAMEVEAYQQQLTMQPWNLDRFSEALATKYFLNLTTAQARALLLESAV